MLLERKRLRLPSVAKLKKIKWGVAGCSKYLESAFLPSFDTLKKSKLVAVYGSDLNRAKSLSEKYGGESAFNDYEQFLKSDFEILYISSINSMHYKQVLAAARAGKNILCEKPLALTSEEAREMVQVCEENNVFLSINYKFRYHPLIKKTKELIAKGYLGKIVNCSASFNIDFPPGDNYRFNKNLSGGGALTDLGTHLFDLFRYLYGEFKIEKAVMDNVVYKSEVEDYATGILKFEHGGYGQINVSYNSMRSFNRIEITGQKGSICIDDLLGNRNGLAKMTINLFGEGKKAFRKRANEQLYLLRDIQKSYQLKNQPLITGKDGLINSELMEEFVKKSGE